MTDFAQDYTYIRVGLDVTREMWAGKPIYYIFNRKSGTAIGRIVWYQPWRQFVATFSEESVWSTGCLADVADAIKKITQHHKAAILAAGE